MNRTDHARDEHDPEGQLALFGDVRALAASRRAKAYNSNGDGSRPSNGQHARLTLGEAARR